MSAIEPTQVVQPLNRSERAFAFGLIFSGIRCTLQYMIFPFVLPLLGISNVVGVEISLGINLLAIVSILFSIRRFWQVNYRYKLQYTLVGSVALVILFAFIALDARVLLGL